MASRRIFVLYSFFALISISLNLGAQALVFQVLDGPERLPVALAFGTAVALVSKFILDKTWIFKSRTSGVRAHGKEFFLYTLMGAGTTLIFWVSETAFHFLFEGEFMTYVGGGISLIVCYVIKYNLDKRYVFNKNDD